MNNGRDCAHGRQVGKCDTCDLIEAEKEIEALKARVEQLQALNANQVKRQEYLESKLYLANAAAPAQCLAEIKAQAVEDAGKYLLSLVTAPPSLHFASADALYKRANQLRQQAKEQK